MRNFIITNNDPGELCCHYFMLIYINSLKLVEKKGISC
jgi:hypothetical protein